MCATSLAPTSLPLEAPVTDRVYNIASSVETSLIELAQLLAEAMGRPDLEPEFGPARKVNPVSRRLADTTAAARELGWSADIPLREGLEDLVAWWRESQ